MKANKKFKPKFERNRSHRDPSDAKVAPTWGNLDEHPSVSVEDHRITVERKGLKGEHADAVIAFLEEADRIDVGYDPVISGVGSSAVGQSAEVREESDNHQIAAIA